MQAYDQRMDAVITPGGLIAIKKNEDKRAAKSPARQQEEAP